MATRKDIALIKQVLIKGLKGLNYMKKPPQITVRKSRFGNNLHVHILSDSFSHLSLAKRHELVENLLQRELDPETLSKISALFVLTSKEADGVFPIRT